MTAPIVTRRRCGVLGSPIAHSLSPTLHRAAYQYLGLDWCYTAHEMHENELPAFLATLDAAWRGLSLTMPLKRVALELAAHSTRLARTVGAANTLVRADDGTWSADNTDVPGLVAAVRERWPGRVGSGCVWGGGATAASAVAALALLETTDVHLHARDATRAAGTVVVAQRVGLAVEVLPWRVSPRCAAADLVVSTVPAGAADALAGGLGEHARPGRVLFDVVYDPWPTQLAAAWEARGGGLVSGLGLLVHQAVGQLRLMTGHDVPPGVLYAAVS